ncbi:MAG: family 10 glycosylhydrolase [Acidobacteria bacterium]|nr:family 10 glycosylhydrolase [Acidobacteriota bacterium]
MQWAQQYRAFWADAFHEGYKTPAQVDQLVENALTAKANAIFMEARVRSNSYFRQSLEGFAEDSAVPAGFDPLEYLIQKAHARGIEVHAWYVVYPLWRTGSPPQNPQHLYHLHGPPAAGDERWLNVSSAGVETLGLDPGHPGVLPYLIDVFLEPVKRYDVDGIHLDYVRYPEDADYGYNRASIERYSRQNNKVGVPSRADGAWNQWRRDQVTALVRQLYLRVQQLRPGVKVSAATITWGNGPLTDAEYRGKDAYGYVFQDWRGWLEEGILDLSVPMNYFVETKYATYLDRWAEYQKNRQYGRGYVNGLGNYLNTLPQTLAQLDRVLRPSSLGNTPLGVCFYSYASTRSEDPAQRPNPEFYQAIGEYFKEQVAVPELPWKTRPVKGHLMGRLEVNGGEKWWADGVMVRLAGREGGEQSRRTDASGFFGWVDLAPGEYKAQIESNGRMVFESDWVRVEAGRVAEIPARLNGDQFCAGRVAQAARPKPCSKVRRG